MRTAPFPLTWYSVAFVILAGCATAPVGEALSPATRTLPALHGSSYRVRPGETLWRIASSYGIEVHILAAANHLSSASQLKAGQKLFIPLPTETNRFLWPVRGSVNAASAHHLAITAGPGSLVRASRSGRVAVATHRLAGWGETVVLDHLDGYYTVYAGMDEILVNPGAAVPQGSPIGLLNSGPLHFEIRLGTKPRNALALLPPE